MTEHPKLNKFWQMSWEPEFYNSTYYMMGTPRKNWHKFIEHIQPNNDEQIVLMNTFNDMVRKDEKEHKSYFIFVSGPKDTGKTLLGSALVNSCQRWSMCTDSEGRQYDWNPRFVMMEDLVERLTNYRSTKDWFQEYATGCRLLVIDRWTLKDGDKPIADAAKKRVERLLVTRNENNLSTVLLSRLLWVEAKEQMSSQMNDDLPPVYVRPLAYPYRDSSNPFNEDKPDYDEY